MAFNGDKPAYGTKAQSAEVRSNFQALVKHHRATTAPTGPENGWIWWDASDPSNERLRSYYEGDWKILFNHMESNPVPETSEAADEVSVDDSGWSGPPNEIFSSGDDNVQECLEVVNDLLKEDYRVTGSWIFDGLTMAGDLAMGGHDISGAGTITAGTLTDGTASLAGGAITGLTHVNSVLAAELSQLETIGTTTISAAQWGYLGAMDQGVATTDSPTFAGITMSGLTASRLLATDASKVLVSSDLASWVAGTANRLTVTDDGDGTVTLTLPDSVSGLTSISASTVTDGTWSTTAGAFTGVASIATPASITMAEDGWIGIGAASERFVFNGSDGVITVTASNMMMSSTNELQFYDSDLAVYAPNDGDMRIKADNSLQVEAEMVVGDGYYIHFDNSGWDITDEIVASFDSGYLDLYATNAVRVYSDAKLGVGCDDAVPVGGIGGAKLAVHGTDGSYSAGPVVQWTTDADDYPLLSLVPLTHDSISFAFDAYYDGSWKSSDAGSNFIFIKGADKLSIYADSGIAAGGDVTWAEAMHIDSSAGVSIGTLTMTGNITMPEDGWIGIGAAAERIVFDGTGGLIKLQDTDVIIGDAHELYFEASGVVAGTEYLKSAADGYLTVGAGTQITLGSAAVSFSGSAYFSGTNIVQFRDSALYISSKADGYLDFDADTGIRLNSDVIIADTKSLTLSATTASGDGVILKGASRFIHDFGTDNIYIGEDAGNFTESGAGLNIGIGKRALLSVTTGTLNVVIGANAGDAITTASYNFCLGYNSGTALQDGNHNVLVGWQTGTSNVSGGSNTCIGSQAGQSITSNYNTCIGYTMGSNITSGTYNVVIGGLQTGADLQTGIGNVLIGGYRAGYNVTGSYNVILGPQAGHECGAVSYNVFLGYKAGYYETGSSKLFIDNASRSDEADARVKALVYGEFNAATASQLFRVNGRFEALESIGIGTTTVPHGGLGYGPLAIDAADPWIQLTDTADDYPIIAMGGLSHNLAWLYFDTYLDSGTPKSSASTNNFSIGKESGNLRFDCEASVAAGSTITWTPAFWISGAAEMTYSPSAARKLYFRDSDISISSGADTILQLEADGYVRIGTGTTSHSLAANGDFLVSGVLEVDGAAWFDAQANIVHGTQSDLFFYNSGTAEALFRANYSFDQMLLGIDDGAGRQIIVTDYANRSVDHDHATQTNPTLYGHDARDPDVSNNAWWSITHDATGMLVSTGANTGAGTVPATIENDIRFNPRGTNQFSISGLGNIVCGNQAALATDATDGFLYIPTCAGAPTGVPTAYTGKVAVVFDTTNDKLYVYDGGWIDVT